MINLNLTPELAQDMANLVGRPSVSNNIQTAGLSVQQAPAPVAIPNTVTLVPRPVDTDDVNVHASQLPKQPEDAANVLVALSEAPLPARAAPDPQLQQVQTWSNKYTLEHPENPAQTAQQLAKFVEAPENLPAPLPQQAGQIANEQLVPRQNTPAPNQFIRQNLTQTPQHTSAFAQVSAQSLTPDAIEQAAWVPDEAPLPTQLMKVLEDAGQPFSGAQLFKPSDVPVEPAPAPTPDFADLPEPPVPGKTQAQAQAPQTAPRSPQQFSQASVQARLLQITTQLAEPTVTDQDAPPVPTFQGETETPQAQPQPQGRGEVPQRAQPQAPANSPRASNPQRAAQTPVQSASAEQPEVWVGTATRPELPASAHPDLPEIPASPTNALALTVNEETLPAQASAQPETATPQTPRNALPQPTGNVPEFAETPEQPNAPAQPQASAQTPVFTDPSRAELFASLPQPNQPTPQVTAQPQLQTTAQAPTQTQVLQNQTVPQQAPNTLGSCVDQWLSNNSLQQIELPGNTVPQQAPNIEAAMLAVRQTLEAVMQAQIQAPVPTDLPDAPVPAQTSQPSVSKQPSMLDAPRTAQPTIPTESAGPAKISGPIRGTEAPLSARMQNNLAAMRGETEAIALSGLKTESSNGLLSAADAKLSQPQAPGTLRQWSGWLPVQLGDQKTPAWIQFEWKKPEGQGGGQNDAQTPTKPIPVSLALHLKSERLGWIGFHLSWAPPELNGSMVVENASVANLASGELRSLERQLTSDETPLVHVEVQRKVDLTLS